MSEPQVYTGSVDVEFSGASIMGAIASAFLFGIIFDLTLHYFRVFFSRDRTIIRLIVVLSFLSIALQVGGITAAQWESFVAHGPMHEAGSFPVGLEIAICLVPIPVLLAQILFAERCYWSVNSATLQLDTNG